MTTLELAEAIVANIHHEYLYGGVGANLPLAVLRTLHEHNSWFCRNPTEDWHEEKEERYEQVEMFK